MVRNLNMGSIRSNSKRGFMTSKSASMKVLCVLYDDPMAILNPMQDPIYLTLQNIQTIKRFLAQRPLTMYQERCLVMFQASLV